MALQPDTRSPDVELTSPREGEQRVGDLLATGLQGQTPAEKAGQADVIMAGYPADEGVTRNRGRAGAAQGPDALRAMLWKMGADARHAGAHAELLRRTVDLGNLVTTGEVETDQQRLADLLQPCLERGQTVVVLGGGHETSYGHFLGYVQAGKAVFIQNWDAHADVRETVEGKGHSGSPFRQALQHSSNLCSGYGVYGLQPQSLARPHLEFLDRYRTDYRFIDVLDPDAAWQAWQRGQQPVMATFDLDGLDQGFAPGVSAPCVNGMDRGVWLQAAYQAGRSPGVRSMDVVELNPAYDRDGQTARLAALTVWQFLQGLAQRDKQSLHHS